MGFRALGCKAHGSKVWAGFGADEVSACMVIALAFLAEVETPNTTHVMMMPRCCDRDFIKPMMMTAMPAAPMYTANKHPETKNYEYGCYCNGN